MKRTLLVLCSLMLLSGAGFAQQMGFKGGATYTTFNGPDADNYKYRVGYTGGIFLQKHINNMMGLQLEALYTSKGARREIYIGDNLQSAEVFKLNYIDVPVLFHVSASGLFFDLGPQVSFIYSASHVHELHSNAGDKVVTTKTDISDNPYTIDFAYVGSLGYRAGNGLGLEVRYTGGLKNIDDEGFFADKERRNAGFSLMLSYLLGH
ncbi:porin family protein [uncultured Pontibacter sp.]|uniref:porin family protein n=1 Tax=uncultured Pontibacter sp. TaxID=453356 RepID=UPI0026268F52|nr:porin family protein [uncultured Pontibacter sp.]